MNNIQPTIGKNYAVQPLNECQIRIFAGRFEETLPFPGRFEFVSLCFKGYGSKVEW